MSRNANSSARVSGYEHSSTFAALKNHKEQLSGNLTTSQYLQIYDEYLERSIAPIIKATNYFDAFLARLIGWQEQNFRRKISFLSRQELPNLVIAFLMQPSEEGRLLAFRRLRLDRGIRVEFIKLFAEQLKAYRQACDCELLPPSARGNPRALPFRDVMIYNTAVKTRFEQQMRVRSEHSLLAVLLESQEWLERALAFKKIIMEKYIRLTLNAAKNDYEEYFNCEVPLDDLIPVYLLATSRAIDKCDSRQGVLTSHIQKWFLTGRCRAQQIADRGKRKISLDDVRLNPSDTQTSLLSSGLVSRSHEQELEAQEELQHQANIIRFLARIADPTGAARAFLGIEESLREDELALLSVTPTITSGTN